MKRSWMLKMATVGLVSGLLFGTVALGQAEPKARSGDVAGGKTLFVRSSPVATGHRVKGMGTSFFVDRIRLTSHHHRPERNPMPT